VGGVEAPPAGGEGDRGDTDREEDDEDDRRGVEERACGVLRVVRHDAGHQPHRGGRQRRLAETGRTGGLAERGAVRAAERGAAEQHGDVGVAGVPELVRGRPPLLAAVLLLDDAEREHDRRERDEDRRRPPDPGRRRQPATGGPADDRTGRADDGVVTGRRDDVGGPVAGVGGGDRRAAGAHRVAGHGSGLAGHHGRRAEGGVARRGRVATLPAYTPCMITGRFSTGLWMSWW
jgi:hypothetical protein